MTLVSATRAAAPATLLLAALVTACTDLPTGSETFQLEADGELWTAVLPPADLPSPATWLAYADAGSLQAQAAAVAVEELFARATEARVEGNAAVADALLEQAAERAVAVLPDGAPGPGVLLSGVATLEGWERRVRLGVDLDRAPALAEAAQAVGRDREAVEAALLNGDLRTAALRLTRASERVRGWGPQGVALRALERVEAHLAAEARSPREVERATHLVQSARAELVGGQPLRAVQRAIYALQLASGGALHEVPEAELRACGEYSC